MSKRYHRDIHGTEFATAREAIHQAQQTGGPAIRLGGRHLVVSAAEANRLEMTGTAFAYLSLCRGRVVTVPVNG